MPRFYFVDEGDIKHITFGGDVIIVKRGIPFSYTYPRGKSKKPSFGHKYGYGSRSTTLLKLYSDFFKLVPDIVKAHWHEYKQYIGASHSGRNPFLKNNIQVGYADVAWALHVDDITSPPQYPDTPIDLVASYDTELDSIIFAWTDTFPIGTIVETGYYNVPGLARPPKEWMRIGKGYASADEEALLPGKTFNPGHKTLVSIRSINMRGEVSPWADPVEIDVPDKPVADFSGAPRKGDSPLIVYFTNLSTGFVKSYLWTFGDGSDSTLTHPFHTYEGIPASSWTVRLLARGLADSENKKTRYSYIQILPDVEIPFLFVSDTLNNRIHKRVPYDLSLFAKLGTLGTGPNNFNRPFGIVIDDYYIYICDYVNCRIIKRLREDLSFVAQTGSEGSAPGQYQYPAGITTRTNYLWIMDRYNHRLIELNKSDLSFSTQRGSQGTGDDQFRWPTGIAADANFLYICDNGNHRIIKRDISTLAYFDKVGSQGSGNDQFEDPYGIAVDFKYLYIGDTGNHRIVKRLKSDLSFVDKIGTQGTGDNQFFCPRGITRSGDYLFICDTDNNRIMKRRRTDLSFVSKIGSLGSGYDQFNSPHYLCAPTQSLPLSCVAWWLLQTCGYDAGNARFEDQSGNNHYAYPHNVSIDTNYSTFNGSAYIDINDFLEISSDHKQFSMAIWVLFSSDHAGTLCSHYDDLDANRQPSWWSIIQTDGKHTHRVYGDNSLFLRKDYISSNRVNDEAWHLLGFTFNNNTFKIFCDGVEDPNPNKYLDFNFPTIFNSTVKLLIGARYWQGIIKDEFTGHISKVYLFDNEINAATWDLLLALGS